METERQERLELARLELIQRETQLEMREAEAERKLAEADRVAAALLRAHADGLHHAEQAAAHDRAAALGQQPPDLGRLVVLLAARVAGSEDGDHALHAGIIG